MTRGHVRKPTQLRLKQSCEQKKLSAPILRQVGHCRVPATLSQSTPIHFRVVTSAVMVDRVDDGEEEWVSGVSSKVTGTKRGIVPGDGRRRREKSSTSPRIRLLLACGCQSSAQSGLASLVGQPRACAYILRSHDVSVTAGRTPRSRGNRPIPSIVNDR